MIGESGTKSITNVTSAGTASERAYIGEAEAKRIALAHAGVNEGDIYGYEFEMDYEHGAMIYELEFDCAGSEYEYDINAATGEIVWYEKDSGGNIEQGGSAAEGKDSVGKDKAVQTALGHAGLTSSQVTQLEAKLDRDGGKLVYEIEFRSGNYEYEYEIDASSGSIIKSEKDLDD